MNLQCLLLAFVPTLCASAAARADEPDPATFTMYADIAPLGVTRVEHDGGNDRHLQVGLFGGVVAPIGRAGILRAGFGLWDGERIGSESAGYLVLGLNLGFGFDAGLIRMLAEWDFLSVTDHGPGTDSDDGEDADRIYLPRVELGVGPKQGYLFLSAAFHVTPHTRRFATVAYVTPRFGAGLAWLGRAIPVGPNGSASQSLGADDWHSLGLWGEARFRLGPSTSLVVSLDLSIAMLGASVGVSSRL